MRKIKNTLSRVRSMSLKRLMLCVGLVNSESGRAKCIILLDMIYCYLRYGMGYLDYLTFGFVCQNKAKRKTYMSMSFNLNLVRRMNEPAFRCVFDNKLIFNNQFAEFLGRSYLDLEKTDPESFISFVEGKECIFAKPVSQFGGKGIERVVLEENNDIPALFKRLRQTGLYVVEQAICQHPEMNRLSDSSVNSIRIVTLRKDEETHVLYSLVRMSSCENYVDNISSGGMYCPVDQNGRITASAFRDMTGEYYDAHPKTGTVFKGFEIPFFTEAIEMVKKAAQKIPKIRYVGWDVAITLEGPLLIEGNIIPAYDMCQNYRHLPGEKIGILPLLKEILKDEY